MNVTITNLGSRTFPVVAWRGTGAAVGELLRPGKALTIDDEAIGVVDCGEVPSFFEQIENAIDDAKKSLEAALREILDFVEQQKALTSTEPQTIAASVQNHGAEGIRALCGSNVDEFYVEPAATVKLTAPGQQHGSGMYIELRQLGM